MYFAISFFYLNGLLSNFGTNYFMMKYILNNRDDKKMIFS